jgi:hypothetical protein
MNRYLVTACALVLLAAAEVRRPSTTPIANYETRNLHGFTIMVNPDAKAQKTKFAAAWKLLDAKLEEITRIVPAKPLSKLRQARIWIEVCSRPAGAMEYHASAEWLRQNGYHPEKAGDVEIANLANFITWTERDQPMMVLHELAHAYHYRVLGVDDAAVKAAYRLAMERKLYDEVAHRRGTRHRGYAATNEMEYFAELTEAYFGTNDFFPFNRAELKQHDPQGFKLMERVWGD